MPSVTIDRTIKSTNSDNRKILTDLSKTACVPVTFCSLSLQAATRAYVFDRYEFRAARIYDSACRQIAQGLGH